MYAVTHGITAYHFNSVLIILLHIVCTSGVVIKPSMNRLHFPTLEICVYVYRAYINRMYLVTSLMNQIMVANSIMIIIMAFLM